MAADSIAAGNSVAGPDVRAPAGRVRRRDVSGERGLEARVGRRFEPSGQLDQRRLAERRKSRERCSAAMLGLRCVLAKTSPI